MLRLRNDENGENVEINKNRFQILGQAQCNDRVQVFSKMRQKMYL